MKKRDYIQKLQVFCVFAMILFFVMMFLRIKGTPGIADVGFNQEKMRKITDEFTFSVNGESSQVRLPAKIDAHAGDRLILTCNLEKYDGNDDTIALYIKQSYARIYLDDELQIENAEVKGLPFPITPGSFWYYFRLPQDYEGKELRIEIEPFLENYAKALPAIYIGTGKSMVYMVLQNGWFSLLMGLIIVAFAVCLLFMGLLLRTDFLGQRLRWLGALALNIGVWSLLEAQVTQIFFGNIPAAAFMLFSFFFAIPVTACAFLQTFEYLKQKKFIRIMFWISAGAFALVQILQLAGAAYYLQLVPVCHVLLALIIGGIIKYYVDMKRAKDKNEDHSIYTAVMILGVFAGVDIAAFYLMPTQKIGDFTRVGILVFIGYLALTAIQQAGKLQVQQATQEQYRELAYTDLMTGLSNRTAFVEKMQELKNSCRETEAILLMADLNDLKIINDKFGHAKGDEAIVLTASILKECFDEKYRCFRIGGDEFCVIGCSVGKEDFEISYQHFLQRLKAEAKKQSYPYFLATGYGMSAGERIDECFKKADAAMYRRKEEMKGNNG